MTNYCLLKTKLLFLKPLCRILFENDKSIAYFGRRPCPKRVTYSRLGGKTASEMILLKRDDNLYVLYKGNEIALKEFWKHASITSTRLSCKKLISDYLNVFDEWLKGNNNFTLFLVHGVNYEANEESGIGRGRVYATPDFMCNGIARHDFVEVKLLDDQDEEYTQTAQVIMLFEYKNTETGSTFHALVQFLEPVDETQKDNVYLQLTWELDGSRQPRPLMMMADIHILQGACWVVPSHGKSIPDNDHVKSSAADVFWYFKRGFMDRSGWDAEFRSEWGTDDDAHLEALMMENQAVGPAGHNLIGANLRDMLVLSPRRARELELGAYDLNFDDILVDFNLNYGDDDDDDLFV
jgi:hypothetical protein